MLYPFDHVFEKVDISPLFRRASSTLKTGRFVLLSLKNLTHRAKIEEKKKQAAEMFRRFTMQIDSLEKEAVGKEMEE